MPIKELLQRKVRGRDWTLNVTERTYKVISRVAEETGNSRPRVLEAFVEEAHKTYQKMRGNPVLEKSR